MIAFTDELRETMRARLDAHPLSVTADAAGVHRAAVAIVVVDDGPRGAAFLLCRRSAKLNRHARQWALPGGRLDPGETVEQAARRELHEELGVDLPGGAVLGRLDDY